MKRISKESEIEERIEKDMNNKVKKKKTPRRKRCGEKEYASIERERKTNKLKRGTGGERKEEGEESTEKQAKK